ncbi:hypothetical protein ACI48D_08485 [Massilia sp. LXY-6]|uniref:hypothetical protein n=1 Tax=Massilia sp. LXY-6 TaxID=3379823 RepID=UPI003EE3E4C6
MSSTRRTANEINILAMLDRHQAAGLPQRILRRLQGLPAVLWYGAAGVLVCALVGMLAWLARDSRSSASVDTALAGAVAPRPAAAAAPVALPASMPAPLPDPVPAAAPGTGATIVDVDVAPAPAPAPAAERALPPQEHAGRIAPHEARRDPQRLAAHAARSAPRAAGQPPAAGTRSVAASHAEPRNRRPAALPKAAPEQVDTDVALISAIIQHASKREEAEEAARKP